MDLGNNEKFRLICQEEFFAPAKTWEEDKW